MTSSTPLPVVVLCGPTASGKSSAAVDVAEAFGGTVVNADSMQVYAGLRVLTARPGPEDEARAPHVLYGTIPPSERYSVGRWLDEAADAIKAARVTGSLPVVAGGTGLYVKALTEGLSPVPEIPDAVREAARARHAELGGEAFRQALSALDAEAASRLPAGDTQRLIRAWEVATATGKTLAEWHREMAPRPVVPGPFAVIALMPERADLYAAIDGRFTRMVEAGALDEVAALDSLGLDADLPAMKALGLAELRAHLHGEMPLESAVEAAQRTTRNFAKRQYTWFRHQISGAEVIGAQYSKSHKEKIFSIIRRFLLTRKN